MSMHYCQQGKVVREIFIVCCKRCARKIPAGVVAFPADNLVIRCTLCDELRRYRPSEVYLDIPDALTLRKPADRERVEMSRRKRA